VVVSVTTDAGRPAPLVVTKARATITFDRERAFLGENVLAHYCVENTSDAAFAIDVSSVGDGAGPEQRFVVSVSGEDGAVVLDPGREKLEFGGLGRDAQLAPGKTWCHTIPLSERARIDAPGTYTVRIAHDLGWPEKTAPIAIAQLSFAMPTPAEAEAVVADMAARPERHGVNDGELAKPYFDFSTLGYPVYLPILERRARAGFVPAVDGLGAIAEPGTTRLLLDLARSPNMDVATRAAEMLARRVPELDAPTGPGAAFRRRFVEASWSPSYDDSARTAALGLLASAGDRDVISAGEILAALGRPSDAGAVNGALERAVMRANAWAIWSIGAPSPILPCEALMRAARGLRRRGASSPTSPKTTAETMAWIDELRRGARPAGWQDELARAMRHRLVYVRWFAMMNAPAPTSTAITSAISTNLAHEHIDVRGAACVAAERLSLKKLEPAVMTALRTARDFATVDPCYRAASALGARGPAVDILVGRLDDKDASSAALRSLLSLFVRRGPEVVMHASPETGRRLIPAWRAFVSAHRAAIDAGEPIAGPVPTRLLPFVDFR
jgi:hypothetical protein